MLKFRVLQRKGLNFILYFALTSLASAATDGDEKSFAAGKPVHPLAALSTQEPVFVLSVDGGGIRGVIPARILMHIEERVVVMLQEQVRTQIEQVLGERLSTPLSRFDVYLARGFQIMAGTSTGGIITLGLNVPDSTFPAIPKFRASALLSLYKDHSKTIFPPYFGSSVQQLLVGVKHDVDALQRLFLQYFGEVRLGQALSQVLVTAYEMRQESLHLFDSQKAKESQVEDFFMRDAAWSTGAAPTFLKAANIKNMQGDERLFADGGIVANNPAMAAFLKAQERFPHASEVVLLSLGTGVATRGNLSKLSEASQAKWASSIASVMMNGASDFTHGLLRDHAAASKTLDYIRVQIQLNKEHSVMDNVDSDNMQYLLSYAERDIKEHAKDLDRFAAKFSQSYSRQADILFPQLHTQLLRQLGGTQALSLTDNLMDEAAAWGVSQILTQNPNMTVTELNLSGCGLTDQGVRLLVKSLTQVRVFNLARNRLSARACQDIATLPALTALTLDENPVGPQGVTALAPLAKRLTNLSLVNAGIKDEGSEGIGKLFVALTNLNLAKNSLTPRGVQGLFSLRLVHLNLSYNQCAMGVIAGLKERDSKTLRSLDLAHNKVTDEQVEALATVLRNNITTLSLYHNVITARSASALERLLTDNATLTSLNISNNDLSDDGTEVIARTLDGNRVLLSLDLGRNNMSDKGALVLADVVTRNGTLTTLTLSRNALSDAGRNAFDAAKRARLTLRVVTG